MISGRPLKVLIASENISMRMGGEASLGYYYLKLFAERGVEVWIVCHARVRDELAGSLPPALFARTHFVEDTRFQKTSWRIGHELLSDRVAELLLGQVLLSSTQRRARLMVRSLVARHDIDVVFQPDPIAPKSLSFMYDVGAPVVIGPMCGGLDFPPAFRGMDTTATRASVAVGRRLSTLAHRLVPGKVRATGLIVANDCTRRALPSGCHGRIYEVPESGVDLRLWKPVSRTDSAASSGRPVRFVFSGRFVGLKGASYLVEAFAEVVRHRSSILELIGDGEQRPEIEARVRSLGLSEHVRFHGWLKREAAAAIVRECDVFVMPSLRECGGTAILEAMAQGLPVIVANWAGPGQYVNDSCGIRVDVSSRESYVSGLSSAMDRLASSAELRQRLGRGGLQRVHENFYDWGSKADRVLAILRECCVAREPQHAPQVREAP